jgi:hypothetical protein
MRPSDIHIYLSGEGSSSDEVMQAEVALPQKVLKRGLRKNNPGIRGIIGFWKEVALTAA